MITWGPLHPHLQLQEVTREARATNRIGTTTDDHQRATLRTNYPQECRRELNMDLGEGLGSSDHPVMIMTNLTEDQGSFTLEPIEMRTIKERTGVLCVTVRRIMPVTDARVSAFC